jgi:mRNA interferase RelE/StbE
MATAAYRLILTNSARKGLASLPRDVQERIGPEITALANDPRPHGCKKLGGSDAYRIRVGNYRVIYTIDDVNLVVFVIGVGHRRDVYRP